MASETKKKELPTHAHLARCAGRALQLQELLDFRKAEDRILHAYLDGVFESCVADDPGPLLSFDESPEEALGILRKALETVWLNKLREQVR